MYPTAKNCHDGWWTYNTVGISIKVVHSFSRVGEAKRFPADIVPSQITNGSCLFVPLHGEMVCIQLGALLLLTWSRFRIIVSFNLDYDSMLQ